MSTGILLSNLHTTSSSAIQCEVKGTKTHLQLWGDESPKCCQNKGYPEKDPHPGSELGFY